LTEVQLQDVLRHHFQTPVPKLWDRLPELGGKVALQALIERAMGKEREDRFPDAARKLAETARTARSGLEARMRKTAEPALKALPTPSEGASTAQAAVDAALAAAAPALEQGAAEPSERAESSERAQEASGDAAAQAAPLDVTGPSVGAGFDATLDAPAPGPTSERPPASSEPESDPEPA
jgi:hypothetical protein